MGEDKAFQDPPRQRFIMGARVRIERAHTEVRYAHVVGVIAETRELLVSNEDTERLTLVPLADPTIHVFLDGQ